ncbi:GL14062 [Drosophila persimilis]|uniref:Pyridoxal phosphate homeostasis protein n=2 Tax=pseudoobscura subgroup TaxID=32358 RepID=A0A6I8WEJ7_DROPS|nr:pyridoxal phosphate homeostasis protein isoform X1 [Drosophila persimilis]XP_002136950.1 pyridoxal phosphate homeostasis protein isoform X1 [Drosophila pseudoobscura]XP_033241846.1 pyridoxal phosphate homeostasis protein isoform X1 [Drosophila pseudoobscura]EDW39376.1 GL14062 [Drosophila persimilis]
MLRRTMAEFDIKAGLQQVLKRIDEVLLQRPKEIQAAKPLLVAVSKTKPADAVIEAYKTGQRDFGENYVQELVEKSQHPEILAQCPDIKWHFIGHLQNNKINKILSLPNLHMIQTVDSEKLATKLDAAWSKLKPDTEPPLRVLIQINTSGEEAKSGIETKEAPKLYQFISKNLKHLQLVGIMTIGAFGFDYSTGPNPDFVSLMEVHRSICEANSLTPNSVLVSMGMSNDYDRAIEMGSTVVRVGSSIFGHRAVKA